MECLSRTQSSQREMCRRRKGGREEAERQLADRVFNIANFLNLADSEVLIFILSENILSPPGA